jgi:hypothetical protein
VINRLIDDQLGENKPSIIGFYGGGFVFVADYLDRRPDEATFLLSRLKNQKKSSKVDGQHFFFCQHFLLFLRPLLVAKHFKQQNRENLCTNTKKPVFSL